MKERYTRGKENNERKKKRQKTLRCESLTTDNKFFKQLKIIQHFDWVQKFGWRSSYQERRVCIPLTDLNRHIVCICPKPEPGFPTSYVVILFCVLWVKMKGDCSFAEIGGIGDHNCSKFLSIKRKTNNIGK